MRWTFGNAARPGRLLLGIAISGGFLYLALRGVALPQVWRRLELARPGPLGLAICVAAASNLFRALRWKIILGSDVPVRLRHVFTSMMIGYLVNNLLPARVGELVRLYALDRTAGVSKSTSAATVILERLVDILVLLVLLLLVSISLPLPDIVRSGSRLAFAVFVAFATLLLLLARRDRSAVQRAMRRIGWPSSAAGQRLENVLDRFLDGLGILRSGRRALLTLALSLVIWCVEALWVGLVMTSLGLSLPWTASFLLVSALTLSFIIPAAPGALGTYEFLVVTVLTLLAVQSAQAVGLAVVLHTVAYLTSTALGLACLWAESLSLRELVAKSRT